MNNGNDVIIYYLSHCQNVSKSNGKSYPSECIFAFRASQQSRADPLMTFKGSDAGHICLGGLNNADDDTKHLF